MPISVGIVADPGQDDRAAALASQLSLPPDGDADVLLAVCADRLEARVRRGDAVLIDAKPTWIDLTGIDTTSGPGRSLKNPLLRAAGVRKGQTHRPTVFDATAGFGEDTWLLAAAGCEVIACERHPVLFALLRDALGRAAAQCPDIVKRITPVHADSLTRLAGGWPEGPPQVVCLDPMFPAARKAAQGKAMRLARLLTRDDAAGDATEADEDAALLDAALRSGAKRIVVKRPAKAPPIAADAVKPVAAHTGRGVRFDVYAVG